MEPAGGPGTDGECTLCELPLGADAVTNDAGEAFCCAGCREVAGALDDVEAVDENDVRAAAADDGESADDGPPEGYERGFFRVDGMHCTTCEAFLEAVATGTDGVAGADASYVTEAVRVDYDPDRLTEAEVAESLSRAGYTASRREDHENGRPDDEMPWRLVGGVMVGMMVMLPYAVYIYPVHFSILYPGELLGFAREQLEAARYFYYVIFLFTSIVLFYTGRPLLRGAVVSLRARQPNMDLLVSLAATSAYVYSTLAVVLGRIDVYYDVTVAIVLVVTAGNYYESAIKRRATELLSDIGTAQVEDARRYDDGETEAVAVEDLAAGDRLLVREGERVPVDGTVVEGECTVDEAVVTGESLPVERRPGGAVVGGSVLTHGAAVIEVDADATSSLDRIVDLVWNIRTSSYGVQKLADKLAVIFVPGVIVLAAVAGGAYLALGAGPADALLVALTVLIVSCPCALGLATPLAVASGIREAMERSVVVFDDTVFERLREVEVVVFDKTGTLTTGRMEVLDADAPADLLDAAAAVEGRSSHPVAEAITAAFGDGPDSEPTSEGSSDRRSDATDAALTDGGVGEAVDGVSTAGDEDREAQAGDRVTEFRSHPTGVAGVVDGSEVLVGHPRLFADEGWPVSDRLSDRVTAAREDGHLPVLVGRDGAAEGVVVVGDTPREGWADTVADLDERGAEVVVLTGDEPEAAEGFRRHPAVERVFAGVPPEGKAATVGRLSADRQVAMVGDGTNDAPALARADLGIALGGGTALAADAADVAIVDDELASVGTVFDLANATNRRIKGNVAWAFCYNAVAIPLALAGLLNPLFAAAAMAGSSLLVVTNSTRDLLDE